MKTAKELQIKQWEYDALIGTRDFLAREEVPVVQNPDERSCPAINQRARFNMEVTCVGYDCGTALCIGGYVKLWQLRGGNLSETITVTTREICEIQDYVSLKDLRGLDEGGSGLCPLYYPEELDSDHWNKLTSDQAVKAIDNFLETARPDWKGVAPEYAN